MRTPTVAPPARAGLDQPSASGRDDGPGAGAEDLDEAGGVRAEAGIWGKGAGVTGEKELEGFVSYSYFLA